MNDSEDTYIDSDGVSWHDYKEYVFVGLLGFCDCRDEKLYDVTGCKFSWSPQPIEIVEENATFQRI